MFIQRQSTHLRWCCELANHAQWKESNRHKYYYDRESRGSKIEPGDLYLVCQKASWGKHKINGCWENATYEIVD